MKKILVLFVAAALLLFSAGCSQGPTERYSELMVQAMGIDKREEGGYEITLLAYKADGTAGMLSNGTEAGKMERISAKGKSVYAAISNITLSTGLAPFYAHNNGIILGEALAKEGIGRVLDCCAQYTEMRPAVNIFVCRGRASEVLEEPGEGTTEDARQLFLIAQSGEENGKIANANSKEIVSRLAGEYIDVYIPVVAKQTMDDRSELAADGTAVFKGDRLAGYLDEAETRGLMLILGKMKKGVAVIEQEEIGRVTCEFLYCKTRTAAKIKAGRPAVEMNVTMRVNLFESDKDPDFKYGTRALAAAKSAAEAYMRDCILNAISKGNSYGCDVFGFGQRIHLKEPGYFRSLEMDWKKALRETEYFIRVDADVRQSQVNVRLR